MFTITPKLQIIYYLTYLDFDFLQVIWLVYIFFSVSWRLFYSLFLNICYGVMF